jgi:hypothetical protein
VSKDRKSYFGSESRAQAGCIVTFELSNGEIRVEHFNELVFTKYMGPWDSRVVTREGGAYIEQAVARADKLGAKILCISTPQTILTDIQGTRGLLDAKTTGAPISLPEKVMLGKVGRLDLFKQPTGGYPDGNIRQVRTRRPSRTGSPGRNA